MSAIPKIGDVIVHKTDPAARSPYGIGLYEGLVQVAAPSLRVARGHADGFARLHELDVWYTDEAGPRHYTRIAQFRPASAMVVARTGC